MLVNFDVPLTDFDGEVIKTERVIAGKLENIDLTLGRACMTALSAIHDKDKDMDGEQKFANYKLGLKISANLASCELTVSEIAKLKERIATIYGPIVIGRAWSLLDPACAK